MCSPAGVDQNRTEESTPETFTDGISTHNDAQHKHEQMGISCAYAEVMGNNDDMFKHSNVICAEHNVETFGDNIDISTDQQYSVIYRDLAALQHDVNAQPVAELQTRNCEQLCTYNSQEVASFEVENRTDHAEESSCRQEEKYRPCEGMGVIVSENIVSVDPMSAESRVISESSPKQIVPQSLDGDKIDELIAEVGKSLGKLRTSSGDRITPDIGAREKVKRLKKKRQKKDRISVTRRLKKKRKVSSDGAEESKGKKKRKKKKVKDGRLEKNVKKKRKKKRIKAESTLGDEKENGKGKKKKKSKGKVKSDENAGVKVKKNKKKMRKKKWKKVKKRLSDGSVVFVKRKRKRKGDKSKAVKKRKVSAEESGAQGVGELSEIGQSGVCDLKVGVEMLPKVEALLNLEVNGCRDTVETDEKGPDIEKMVVNEAGVGQGKEQIVSETQNLANVVQEPVAAREVTVVNKKRRQMVDESDEVECGTATKEAPATARPKRRTRWRIKIVESSDNITDECRGELPIGETMPGEEKSCNSTPDVPSSASSELYLCSECGYVTADRVDFVVHEMDHDIEDAIQSTCADYDNGDGCFGSDDDNGGVYFGKRKRRRKKAGETKREKANKRTLSSVNGGGERPRRRAVYKQRNALYQCSLCDYKTLKKSNFLGHERTHSRAQPFMCELCGHRSNFKSDIKRHQIAHHYTELVEADGDGKLESRGKRFNVQPVEKGLYMCDQCGHKADKLFLLKRHQLTHSEVKRYKCGHDGCAYESHWKADLERHLMSHDPVLRPLACPADGCTFRADCASALKRHEVTHGVGQRLKSHVCPYAAHADFSCGYSTDCAQRLRKHVERKHDAPDAVFNHTLTAAELAAAKPFACAPAVPGCPYRTARRSDLAAHRRTHLGAKRHGCDFTSSGNSIPCGYRCDSRSHLVRHALVKHGVRLPPVRRKKHDITAGVTEPSNNNWETAGSVPMIDTEAAMAVESGALGLAASAMEITIPPAMAAERIIISTPASQPAAQPGGTTLCMVAPSVGQFMTLSSMAEPLQATMHHDVGTMADFVSTDGSMISATAAGGLSGGHPAGITSTSLWHPHMLTD